MSGLGPDGGGGPGRTGGPGSSGDTVSHDRYRLDSRIATGGMGEVWRATDTVLGREVAVKLLKAEYADDPTFRSRFDAEARHAAALHHPGIAAVFDYGALPARDGAKGTPFLVMELVPGKPLSSLLRGDEPMPADTAADLVAQAADALGAAHARGIVHRDVKPGNLLVTPDRRVKVTDFGIARAADAVALTGTGEVLGTPHYLSPEQAEGRETSPATDVYSLGVVLFECLTGHRPFHGDTPVATALAHLREPVPPLPDDVPDQLRDVVTRAMAKDPADRFESGSELAAALRGAPVSRRGAGAAGAAAAGLAAGGAAGAAAGAAAEGSPTRVMPSAGATHGLGHPATRSGPPPAPADDRDDRRQRRRGLPPWWPVAAGALAVLAVLGILWLAGGDNPDRDTTGTGTDTSDSQNDPAPQQPQEPAPEQPQEEEPPPPAEEQPPAEEEPPPDQEQVEVVAEDYVGRPVDDVAEELESLGLEVDEEQRENTTGEEEGTVAEVTPTGSVDPGTEITLFVWEEPVEPEPEPAPEDEGDGNNGGGNDEGVPGEGDGNNGQGNDGQGNGEGNDPQAAARPAVGEAEDEQES